MYVEIVPNRNSRPAVLLREGWREGKKVCKRTLANLSDWPAQKVAALRRDPRGREASTPTALGRVERIVGSEFLDVLAIDFQRRRVRQNATVDRTGEHFRFRTSVSWKTSKGQFVGMYPVIKQLLRSLVNPSLGAAGRLFRIRCR